PHSLTALSSLSLHDALPISANWKELIPETENVLRISTGGGKLFARYLKDAVSLVQQYDMDGKLEWTIDLPGPGSAGGFSGKQDQDRKSTRLNSSHVKISYAV